MDEGPLDPFADVWQEICEDNLEKENKRTFYYDWGILGWNLRYLRSKSDSVT